MGNEKDEGKKKEEGRRIVTNFNDSVITAIYMYVARYIAF